MAGLSCSEIIDEIQARTGRTQANDPLVDTTRCTRWINEGQRVITQQITGIPSLTFDNKTTHDTTGTTKYSLVELTIGDDVTTGRHPSRLAQMWYLDGNDTRELDFLPPQEFDNLHPDPTHADEHFGKPWQYTQRNNYEVEIYPYCDSAYWDKDLRFVGDYYPLDFTTDSTEASDISMADELLTQYGIWQAWKAIGNLAEQEKAYKVWTNPEPRYGETIGLFEQFKDRVQAMPGWDWNLYGPTNDFY